MDVIRSLHDRSMIELSKGENSTEEIYISQRVRHVYLTLFNFYIDDIEL